jgi:spore maturation protein CgeB
MSGGLQFTSYNEEIASYFDEDKEIVLYHNKEEMIDKAKFYLDPKHEKLVNTMKIAARKRAERDHTWTKRFDHIFRVLYQ